MKKMRFAFVLLVTILISYDGGHAQDFSPKSVRRGP